MASLHVAVLYGDEELTRSLLENGADVNTYDKHLGTPLSIAVLKGYRSIVKALHEYGADHNDEQFTSALIHSTINELKLPDITPCLVEVDGVAAGYYEDRDHQSAFPSDGEHVADGRFREEEFDNASTGFRNLPLRPPNGVITTLYVRNGKLEESPTGAEAWLSHDPLQEAEDEEEWSTVRIMDRNDNSEWFISELQIRGWKLCRFISRVLQGYPSTIYHTSRIFLNTNTDEIHDANFSGLFHRSDEYIRLCDEEVDIATKAQAELLLQCLKPLWRLIHGLVEESKATGYIKHGHLWAIFRPEQVILMPPKPPSTNHLSAAKIKSVTLVRDYRRDVYDLELTVDVVDWNGSRTGYVPGGCLIKYYNGFRKMGDAIFPIPISYASNPEAVRETLIRRGRKFESLRGCFFMTRKEYNIQRRVIVDNYAFNRFEKRCYPEYISLDEHSKSGKSDDTSDADDLPHPGSSVDILQPTESRHNVDLRPLTDDECLLCVPTMHGFDIQEKKWVKAEVGGLESVVWNDQAFKHLTMQEGQKRLILAFTKQKQIEEIKFDDFIAGKGKSLIILLCGPPGVGKTLTAESVAERSRAPLYTLSAGDLGTDASSVESALKGALELCTHWKAVLLIDEADVFLEARKTDNLQRNELVSVFLRLLEYYQGILFLTTNRAATIDTAFESRIDLIIPYEDLDQAARRQVWNNFVKTLLAAEHELYDADFDELSRRKLNGREIKSTVKTSLMLATSEGQTLQMQHINVVLNIRQRAADYLNGGA